MFNKIFAALLLVIYFLCISDAYAKDPTTHPRPVIHSKIINVNPDLNGEPWWAGGVPEKMTTEQLKRLEAIPLLDLSARRVVPPYKLDNSKKKFFRPIFRQQGGSCAQASGVGYHFTYEVNFEQNTSAHLIQNQFPSHYTWNFLNDGIGNGSHCEDGWDIIKANGCPTIPMFGGMAGDDITDSKWMNGYERYLSGMQWRIKSVNRVKVTTVEGLNTVKQWLFDHGEGLASGGIINFSTVVCDDSGNLVKMDKLPAGTEDSGKWVVTKWGTAGGHAMTIVGYNDSVRFDYNKDGKYTTDVDINGDGKVDLRDWEKGAYMVANSWGPAFADSGFVYMMYKVGADDLNNGGLSASNNVLGIRALIDNGTKINYRIKIRHNIRNKIKLYAGIANDTAAKAPEFEYFPPLFFFQGGDHPLEGKFMGDEIEIGLDVNKLLPYLSGDMGKFFLVINSEGGSGKVASFSLVEYRNPYQIMETKCKTENVEIAKGATVLSITYKPQILDLLITTKNLPPATVNVPYSAKLEATGGTPPYTWSLNTNMYSSRKITEDFPAITKTALKPDNNDDGIATQKLDFEFPFYGEKFNTVSVSTDGSVLFSPDFQYIRSHTSIPRFKTITVFGADMIFEVPGDSMYYEGNLDCATFRWKTTKFWGKDDKVNIDVAVRLYPSGLIKLYYNKDLTNDITGIAYGISKGNEQDFQFMNVSNTSQIPDNYSLEFTPFQLPAGIEFKADGSITGTPTENNKSWMLYASCRDTQGLIKTKAFTFAIGVTPIAQGASPLYHAPLRYFKKGNTFVFTYSSKNDAHVTLTLLSATGRTVRTLVNERKKSGPHSMVWNPRGSLPSGVYFCKLSTNSMTTVKKIVVTK